MFKTNPQQIEDRSMEIIAPHLEGLGYGDAERKICARIIHATGDVGYAPIVKIDGDLMTTAKMAIPAGKNIFTDVEMVRRGINIKTFRKFGGEIFCKISDVDTRELAKREGITRAMAAMRLFGKQLDDQIVVIGNAPTALFEVLRLVKEENIRPAFVIGVPVGFVGAAEAKSQLVRLANEKFLPYITVEGTKGGSSVAVAAVNAILYMFDDSRR